MFLLMPRKSICVMFNALKKPFRAMSCWGDSWRRVLPWQLLNHLSGSCLWVLLRFRASRSSWTCPPVLRHICGPCRPGRGREQTQPFGDPPMWQKQVKCVFLAQTHLWVAEREREMPGYFYAICWQSCMYAWIRPAALYTWHNVPCRVTCTVLSWYSVEKC